MSVSPEELDKQSHKAQTQAQTQAVPPMVPGSGQGASPAGAAALVMPQGSAPAAATSVSARLELLVMRDRLIQSELVRLQRTLSRQNFRGAESARRLVRKLARKAEQNASDLESLLRSPF